MRRRTTFSIAVLVVASVLMAPVRADAPHVYAITGARIVTVSGPTIDKGALVLRNGLIEAVGATVTAPADAVVIDGSGLTVYPGLIDMGHTGSVDAPVIPEPRNPETREQVERWKRSVILRPDLEAAAHVRVDSPELTRLAAGGITTVLATPAGDVVRGRSSLVNVVAPEEDPQIGDIAATRRGLVVVRTPVALHVTFSERPRGSAYPNSLMGVVAFVRQAFLDAQHYQVAWQHYQRVKGARPAHDPALEALQPAIEGKLPVAFQAGSPREIRRALKMASDLKLDAIVTGGLGAAEVAAELKAAGARVVYSLDYPTRPRTLAPDADEPLRTLRERAGAPKAPAMLDKAGVLFAFQTGGLGDAKDFVKNAAKAVKEGLPADRAIRALTINAAKIAGADDRLGSLDRGKIANLIVTEGALFDEKMKLRHVFVDGRPARIEDQPPRRERTER